MMFSFNKYLQPAWKFNVMPKGETFSSFHFHPELLPLQDDLLILPDENFTTEAARNLDIGFQAWNRGAMTWADKETVQHLSTQKPSLHDEYAFTFKYGGKHWAAYSLFRRLISLHNPIKEVQAFKGASHIKKINRSGEPLLRLEYHLFQSPLLKEAPFVSVIIPTLNRYPYLKDVLLDLEKQLYKNFEVIVIDQSQPFDEDFYKQFNLKLQVVHQNEKLLWTARNNAVKMSTADYLLFFDDDSRVDPDWITQHLKALDYFSADISAGVSLAVIGAKVPESYNFFRWADQFDSGNAMVKREVFKKIGLFDLHFNKQSMGDGEFGIRAYLHGLKSVSNPYAKRIHLKVAAGGLREIGHWDGFRPKKWFAPKPLPSVVYLYKKHYPKALYREAILMGIMLSNVSFKNKRSSNMLAISLLLTVVKSPLLLIQFMKSKRKANQMLLQGDKIEYLP